MLVLMGVSAFLAYEIQRGFSEEADQAYHAHIQHDQALQRLRRTLWLSSILVRDFLLSDSPDRESTFANSANAYRLQAAEAVSQLARNPIPGQDLDRVNAKLAEFWTTVAAVPAATRSLSQHERYEHVQGEITSRRRALSDLLEEVTSLSRSSLQGGERRLSLNRRTAGRRLAGLVALAILAGMMFAALGLRRMNVLEAQTTEQYEEVSRTKAELQALSAQLMSIQEAERARLSRELHDEIGQALATLRLELARLESDVRRDLPDIRTRLGRSRDILDETVKSVRSISLLLRPSLLDDLGLLSAVQWLAEDFSRRTGIACRVDGRDMRDDLPMEHRTCLYRLAQEALHNVEKHAGATRVAITLEQGGAELGIAIDDNGCGLEPPNPARRAADAHLGILGMRERVLALDGEFSVGPAAGGGTRVEARIPLPTSPTLAEALSAEA